MTASRSVGLPMASVWCCSATGGLGEVREVDAGIRRSLRAI